jgi:hypothetical protein
MGHQKIHAFIPIYASAKFSIDKPTNWDDMTKADREIYFLNCADPISKLCFQCSDTIQSDFEVNLESALDIEFEEIN